MQKLLRIVPEVLHQFLKFAGGASQIVVKLRIHQQLPEGALAGVYLVDRQIDLRQCLLELVAEFVALHELAGSAFARIQVFQRLSYFGHALAGVGINRFVLQ